MPGGQPQSRLGAGFSDDPVYIRLEWAGIFASSSKAQDLKWNSPVYAFPLSLIPLFLRDMQITENILP